MKLVYRQHGFATRTGNMVRYRPPLRLPKLESGGYDVLLFDVV